MVIGYRNICFVIYKLVRLAVACSEKGIIQTYPFIEKDSCGLLRNHQKICQNAELAVKENQSVNDSNALNYLAT